MSRNTVGFGWWGRAGTGVSAGSRDRRVNRRRLRPGLLELEERRLLATLMVTSNADTTNAGTLRSAVNAANAAKSPTNIELELGTAAATINLALGQLVLSNTAAVTIYDGPGQGPVTVSGGGKNRVFEVSAGATASISGLSITGGGGTADRGGGLLNLGNVTLTNCTISGNTARESSSEFPGNGGGLANYGTATLNYDTLSGNSASYNGGGLANYGTATLANCTVSGNTAKNNGGGVYNNGTTATLTNCTVTSNTASGYGGGLYNNATANLTLTNCTVSSDSAGGSFYGGGLDNDATATLMNCTFSFDTAGRHGGGLYNNATAFLTNCTFYNNTAGHGGGTWYGGGLYNNSDARLVSCTFSNNTAAYGGGLYCNRSLAMTNTIVAGNTAVDGGPDIYGKVNSGGNNLIGKRDGSSGWVSSDLTGTIASPLSPLLAPLGFYGGPTQTMALIPGSPGIPGSPAIGKGVAVPGITTDQRGFPLDSPSPDIGAFQVQSGPLAWQVNTTADGSGVPSGKLDLGGAVNLANVLTGAHAITFDPTVFATAQTITLTSGQAELSNKTGAQTIIGPAAGVTVNGGGLSRVFQVDAGVTASISGLTITGGGGTADRGGGLLNLGNVTLTNCTISGNTAVKSNSSEFFGDGGGLANYGTATLANCTVSGDTATNNGGGVFNIGTATLTNCTLSGNVATQKGGGLANNTMSNNGNSTATLTNCTVTSNTAGTGGGVYNNGTTVTLTNCTDSGNTAGTGGGFFSASGAATLTNTIVAGNTNTSNSGASDIAGAVSVSGTFNLIGTGGSGGLTNGVNGNIVLTSLTGLGLAPLGFYGGPTQTMALLPGSAAIDAGASSISGVTIPTTDQRGALRGPLGLNAGTAVDIGAYEASSSYLVTSTADSYDVGTLRAGVGWANVSTNANPANIASPAPNTLVFDTAGAFATPQTITLSPSLGTLELSNVSTAETITGPAVGVTVSGGGLFRVFQVDTGVTASISRLTITGGGGTANQGGGLLDLGTANLTLTNCTISGDTASTSGGGLANFGTATLTKCTISGDTASTSGGGLANYGGATLTDCTISGNTANTGGGVFNNVTTVTLSPTLTLTDCTVSGNTANTGGGVFNNVTTVTLTNCTISGNTAKEGGGVFNGGGTGTATLINCTISANTATFGGGLISFQAGRATLINCTVSGNTAGDNGGGLFDSIGPMILTNCTVSGNTAKKTGGGLYNMGTATLRNTIVAANTAATAPDFSGAVVSQGNNLIGKDDDSSGWIIPGAGNSDLTGTIAKPLDPLLAPLGNYGGPTQTVALLPGSPAIGAGSSGVVPAELTTDQRGLPRGSLVDIGAYQTSLVVESTSGSVSVITAPINQLTLPGAVSLAEKFAGPIAISFSSVVFASMQTITLTGNQLELSKTGAIPTWTITGPVKGVTVSGDGLSRVFQVDAGVTASISQLTITGGTATSGGGGLINFGTATLTNCTVSGNTASTGGGLDNNGTTVTLTNCTVTSNTSTGTGGGLTNFGTATLTDCTVSGNTAGGSGAIVFSSGGTLTVSNSTITGSTIAVKVIVGATVTITGGAVSTGNGTGILVGSGPSDSCTVAVHNVDLSTNTAGVQNIESRPVDATLDWWGSSSGPGGPGASTAVGLVNVSPWLGNAQSLKEPTPDSLGFATKAGESYAVTPITTGSGSPKLSIALGGNGNTAWSVTPTGTMSFTGSGGSVTINGESGTGFNTNAFTITNAAVTFAADDAFQGATIQLSGDIKRGVDAMGTANTFYVSGWTGAGTLTAPEGAISTVVASNNAGYTLTDASLTSKDGMNLKLSGITTANLTATATSGNPTVIVDASAFTGGTYLTVGGTGPAILYGGKGGGSLTTMGSGNDVLIGGAGANALTDNGTGFNILIGGGGPNEIYGNGKDILISGTTIYNPNTPANIAALDAILTEWYSNDSYAMRINTIFKGIVVGPNSYGLNGKTVHSNGQSSVVSDGPMQSQNQNWFIVNSTDLYTHTSETVTIINT